MLRIFGTETSPYVRRTRILAHELELEHELVDTSNDAGQAQLRERSPLWKVPTVDLDGQLLYDSRIIGEHLVERFGQGRVTPPTSLDDRNVITVVDGALDSLINVFYLQRDGVSPEQASYLAKQRERAAAAMTWVEGVVEAKWQPREGLSLAELAFATAGAWMRFRGTYPIEQHSKLIEVIEHREARPSFAATRPPGA